MLASRAFSRNEIEAVESAPCESRLEGYIYTDDSDKQNFQNQVAVFDPLAAKAGSMMVAMPESS